MNYISHLSQFYQRLPDDQRFTPHHLSLYMAVFQAWNTARFAASFYVDRTELMNLSKIGSVNTYIRCLKNLHDWNFINYQPSRSMSIGSRISIIIFDNTVDNATDNTNDYRDETELRRIIKQNESSIKIEHEEVENYFKENEVDLTEARRFFNYYEARGWKTGKTNIINWKALAQKWISNGPKFKSYEKLKPNTRKPAGAPKPGNLSATSSKNYNEPL